MSKPRYLSKKELAALYGITVRMLLKEVTEQKILPLKYYKARRLLTPSDIQKIINKIGEPC